MLNMYETFYKVHGSTETIMTVATLADEDLKDAKPAVVCDLAKPISASPYGG